jgi:hypothetical protein
MNPEGTKKFVAVCWVLMLREGPKPPKNWTQKFVRHDEIRVPRGLYLGRSPKNM